MRVAEEGHARTGMEEGRQRGHEQGHERASGPRRVVGGRAVDDRALDAVGMTFQEGMDDHARRGDAHDARPPSRDARPDELGHEVGAALLGCRRQLVAAPEAGQVRSQAVEPRESLHVPTPLPATLAGPVDEDDGRRARGAGLLHVHPARPASRGAGPHPLFDGQSRVHDIASSAGAALSASVGPGD
jgi:hypothetical protein